MRQLATKQEFDALLASASGSVFVDFTATWCGPCRMIAPVYESLAAEFPWCEFIKIDVDQNQEVSAWAGVTSMPTFKVYRAGSEVGALKGAFPDALRNLVRTHCARSAAPAMATPGAPVVVQGVVLEVPAERTNGEDPGSPLLVQGSNSYSEIELRQQAIALLPSVEQQQAIALAEQTGMDPSTAHQCLLEAGGDLSLAYAEWCRAQEQRVKPQPYTASMPLENLKFSPPPGTRMNIKEYVYAAFDYTKPERFNGMEFIIWISETDDNQQRGFGFDGCRFVPDGKSHQTDAFFTMDMPGIVTELKIEIYSKNFNDYDVPETAKAYIGEYVYKLDAPYEFEDRKTAGITLDRRIEKPIQLLKTSVPLGSTLPLGSWFELKFKYVTNAWGVDIIMLTHPLRHGISQTGDTRKKGGGKAVMSIQCNDPGCIDRLAFVIDPVRGGAGGFGPGWKNNRDVATVVNDQYRGTAWEGSYPDAEGVVIKLPAPIYFADQPGATGPNGKPVEMVSFERIRWEIEDEESGGSPPGCCCVVA